MATIPLNATAVRRALRNPKLEVYATGWMGLPYAHRIQDARMEKGHLWVQEAEGLQGWYTPTSVKTILKD